MSRVSTNTVGLQYAIEASLGVLPGTPIWKILEPNDIGQFGATISKVSRNPISKERQRKKGATTDLDSAVDFDADVTMDHFNDFIEGFVFANAAGPIRFGPLETDQVTACDANSYTVDANGALAQDTLIFVNGFSTVANNGLKEVATGSTGTDIPVEETLTIEAVAPGNASIDVCGFRTAAGDLDVASVVSNVVTLTTTTLDMTTLGLTAGQTIYIGGEAAINKFLTNPVANSGFGRVVSVAANTLVLDKTSGNWVVEANTAQLVDIYFGKYYRNVPVDDGDYLERSFTFEGSYPDLGGVGTPEYEYAVGNYCNTVAFQLPLTDKATMSFGFIGTNTLDITPTRDSEGGNAYSPTQTVAFNTSADIARLRITEVDETGITTYFKSLTLTMNNNVSPEKVLGTLGAAFMNVGNFDIDIESQVLFTDKAVINAIKNNTTVTMDFSLRNDNGGFFVDIPSMTINGGDKEFPENETVLINTPAEAFEDATYGTSIGISSFAFLPSA